MVDVDRSLRLKKGQFLTDEYSKDLIVLHHTEGASAKSTFEYWNSSPSRTATAFIVERDGTIYEVFDPKRWAVHVGVKNAQKETIYDHEKRSIGIEIACEGVLKLVDGQHRAFVSDKKPKGSAFKGTLYDHGADWRSYRYFAAYTAKQLAAVNALVDDLCTRFNIPRRTPKDGLNFDKSLLSFTGIVGHNHMRGDKSDLHPGFDWTGLKTHCSLNEV